VILNLEFNKGIGVDATSGKILKSGNGLSTIGNNFSAWLTKVLNGKEQIPEYFKESRLIAISKTGKSEVELNQIRPIKISSHLTKPFE
jgi:hypothetical protein